VNPPQVLLERSFLHALTDGHDEHHRDAITSYQDLVEAYEAGEVLIVAVSDHLRAHRGQGRTGLLAPVDPLHVGAQHRRAARRMRDRQPDADLALTLVMCERHKVSRIATFDPRLSAYALDLLPGSPSIVPQPNGCTD